MGELSQKYKLKALIPLNNKILLDWAISSFPIEFFPASNVFNAYKKIQWHFILRSDVDGFPQLQTWIQEKINGSHVHTISETTRGPLETVGKIIHKIPKEDAVLVMDGDLHVQANSFFEHILHQNTSALLSFPSTSPHFSYVDKDANGMALEVAEKKVISPWALAGVYFFSRAVYLQKACMAFLNNTSVEEKYLSQAVQFLIEEGILFKVFMAKMHLPLGTQEEYLKAQELISLI